MQFNSILMNISMEGSLNAAGFRVKVDHYLGGIVITDVAAILTWR